MVKRVFFFSLINYTDQALYIFKFQIMLMAHLYTLCIPVQERNVPALQIVFGEGKSSCYIDLIHTNFFFHSIMLKANLQWCVHYYSQILTYLQAAK